MAYTDETGTYKSASDWNTGTGGTGGGLPGGGSDNDGNIVLPGEVSLTPYFPTQERTNQLWMIHDGSLYYCASRGGLNDDPWTGEGSPNETANTYSREYYKGMDHWIKWRYPVDQDPETTVVDGRFGYESANYVLFSDGNLYVWGLGTGGNTGSGYVDSPYYPETQNTNTPRLLDTNVYSLAHSGESDRGLSGGYGSTYSMYWTKARKYFDGGYSGFFATWSDVNTDVWNSVAHSPGGTWVYWKPTDTEARTGSMTSFSGNNFAIVQPTESNPWYGISTFCFIGRKDWYTAGDGSATNDGKIIRRGLIDIQDDVRAGDPTGYDSGIWMNEYVIRQVYLPRGHVTPVYIVAQHKTDGRVWHIYSAGYNLYGACGVDYYDSNYTTSNYVRTFKWAKTLLPSWQMMNESQKQVHEAWEPRLYIKGGHTSGASHSHTANVIVTQYIRITDQHGLRHRFYSVRAAGQNGNGMLGAGLWNRSSTDHCWNNDDNYKTYEYIPPSEAPGGSFDYNEAKADATSRGGELAVFHSAADRERCRNMLLEDWWSADYANMSGNNEDWAHAWIGLTDKDHEGLWKWEDGTWLDHYVARWWNPSQPDDSSANNMSLQATDPEVSRSALDYRTNTSSYGGRVFDCIDFFRGAETYKNVIISARYGNILSIRQANSTEIVNRWNAPTTDLETTEQFDTGITNWLAEKFAGGKLLKMSNGEVLYVRCWPRKGMQGTYTGDWHVHGMEAIVTDDYGINGFDVKFTNEQFEKAALKHSESTGITSEHEHTSFNGLASMYGARSGFRWNYFRDREKVDTADVGGHFGDLNEIMVTSLTEVKGDSLPGTILMTTTGYQGALLWRSYSFGQSWECLGVIDMCISGDFSKKKWLAEARTGGVYKAIVDSDEAGNLMMCCVEYRPWYPNSTDTAATIETGYGTKTNVYVSTDHGNTWSLNATLNTQAYDSNTPGMTKLGFFKHMGGNTFIGCYGLGDARKQNSDGSWANSGKDSWNIFRGTSQARLPWRNSYSTGYAWQINRYRNIIDGAPLNVNWHGLSVLPTRITGFGNDHMIIPLNLKWNQQDHNNAPFLVSYDDGNSWEIKWFTGDLAGPTNWAYTLAGNIWWGGIWQNANNTLGMIRATVPLSTDTTGTWTYHTTNEAIITYTLTIDNTNNNAGIAEDHAHISAKSFGESDGDVTAIKFNDMSLNSTNPQWGDEKFGYILQKKVNINSSTIALARDGLRNQCAVEVAIPGCNQWQVETGAAAGGFTGRHKHSFREILSVGGLNYGAMIDDRIFMWGRNDHYQLGYTRNTTGEARFPQEITLVGGEHMYEMIQDRPYGPIERFWGCTGGGYYYDYATGMFVVDKDDVVWAWGQNYKGSLGVADSGHIKIPTIVKLPKDWTPNLGTKVMSMMAGDAVMINSDNLTYGNPYAATLFVGDDGSFYASGYNYNNQITAKSGARDEWYYFTKLKSPIL